MPRLQCFRCKKRPDEISEYIAAAYDNEMTPDEYVLAEEGTLNADGYFVCTACYIAIGMPTAPRGRWVAPTPIR